MDEKTKLFVFTRLEVFLFFIFVVLIAGTSLIVGFNIGKKYSLLRDGFVAGDQQKVELMSGQEEMVEQIVAEQEGQDSKQKEKAMDKTYSQLANEFNKLDQKKNIKNKDTVLKSDFIEKEDAPKTTVDPSVINSDDVAVDKKTLSILKIKDGLTGKYTVQLAAFRSMRDAEDFADGFKVRGYEPIISEGTVLKGANRGTWYRVSLGVFDNIRETNNYIKKEKSLLMGSDYTIKKFD